MGKCFFCRNESLVSSNQVWNYDVKCSFCGTYYITNTAVDLLSDEIRHKLSIILRERNNRGLSPISIFEKYPSERVEIKIPPIYLIEELLKSFPKSATSKLERSLINLAKVTAYQGSVIKINPEDRTLFFTDTNNSVEYSFLVNQMIEDGYIVGSAAVPTDMSITFKGWNRIVELENKGYEDSTKVFVAMWFDEQMDTIYSNAISKAIENNGFEPIRIDKKEHNNKIDDEIIAEIRESKFVIADFTGHRGGVYFEAGFAMGLGKKVIWTCRNNDLENLHFDTRQYSHIVWENEEDLYIKLMNRIRATI
ncbi:nucleoside 2-deoxyribosyltransferase [Oceanobacillus sp. FSL W7-1309]|uniref:nucleoside 2-deoxyribosyltransferase n=1 Tax=Oceanobacillus sp. FSL W7-1309 TaxID=2954539 RepID=UPI0030FC0A10